jgi:tRNA(Ile)-lysidine synthase
MAISPEKLPGAVADFIARERLIQPGDRVLAAVSGGPDSVALLDILLRLGDWPVEAAHFDHGTRGGDSARDAEFVERLAASRDLPFHCERRPVAREARDAGASFEQFAREARYEFLLRTARARSCHVIATGHHAGDLAETMLLRVIRGASPSGLAGIPARRQSGGAAIVRPLLKARRRDIEDYVEAYGLEHRVDATNADTAHPRNRIRHELLPLLVAEYNPRIAEALSRLAALQADEDDCLEREAAQFLNECLLEETSLDRRVFAAAHPALQRRGLLQWLRAEGVPMDFTRVEEVRGFLTGGAAGKRYDLGEGVVLGNSSDFAELSVAPSRGEHAGGAVPLRIPGETPALGRRFSARMLDDVPADPAEHCLPWRQVFDADALGGQVVARRRLPGDRFRPLGAPGGKKLKEYFRAQGIPVTARETHPLLVGKDGIAWVVGCGVAAYAAVGPGTRRAVAFEVTDAS